MLIEQIMSRPVHSCRPEDSLARAAQLMWEHDCGCLPVLESDGAGRVVGMITDRDICMCAWFKHEPLQNLPVSAAMAKQVQTCRPSDELEDAEQIMRAARIRRLPVVGDDGALVGMISLADLASEALRERDGSSREITENAVGHTLAAICSPQHRDLAAA